jgi:activator of HSP90 ATPase
LTGLSAQIDAKPGGAFSTFKGLVAGWNLDLLPGRRIVQAWRLTEEFDPGVYSLVHFELEAIDHGTRITLDHTGFPEGHYDHLYDGWPKRYWDPLRRFVA